MIDTLRMLLKDRLGDVNKVIGIKNKLNNFKPKDDKNIDGFLLFKNNILASIQSLDMKSYDNFDIIIYGRKGKIEITDNQNQEINLAVYQKMQYCVLKVKMKSLYVMKTTHLKTWI